MIGSIGDGRRADVLSKYCCVEFGLAGGDKKIHWIPTLVLDLTEVLFESPQYKTLGKAK